MSINFLKRCAALKDDNRGKARSTESNSSLIPLRKPQFRDPTVLAATNAQRGGRREVRKGHCEPWNRVHGPEQQGQEQAPLVAGTALAN